MSLDIGIHQHVKGLTKDAVAGAHARDSAQAEQRFHLKGKPIMKPKRTFSLGLLVSVLLGSVSIALAAGPVPNPNATLVDTVRSATAKYEDVAAAEAAGYSLFHGCVSGQQEGAMGIHFVNGALVGDGTIDAQQPEALIYEPRNGQLRLVGVEYVVLADDWNAKHATPPVLMGQLFNLNGGPNRYGIPAFYELHVWAWTDNPNGMFVDWNPRVSCEEYNGDATQHADTHSVSRKLAR